MAEDRSIFDDIRVDKRSGKDVRLDLISAYRQTKNLPQAVLKVSSYSHGTSRVKAHASYISRKGKLEVEDPQGDKLLGLEDVNQRIEQWEYDFDTRKNSRDTVNIVLSAPKGSDVEAVKKSVRQFAKNEFGEINDYLFAIHNDTDHPHGHLIVKMRGYDGEKLNPGKKDLKAWRESFAESLRENGIEVDATPRHARGVGKRGRKQSIRHIEERQEIKVDREAVVEFIKENKKGVDQSKKPWAVSAKKNTEQHKQTLNKVAEQAGNIAEQSQNDNLRIMSKKIKQHAAAIPEPKTRAEEYQQKQQMSDRDKHLITER